METGFEDQEQIVTDNTGVAAQAVLADLTMPGEVRKQIRAMKSALSRTKRAVDMVGVAETKAIDNAFAGVDDEIVQNTLYAEGLVMEERDGVWAIFPVSKNVDQAA